MYMSREIMHCKPGKVKDLVVKFKALSDAMKGMGYPPVPHIHGFERRTLLDGRRRAGGREH